MAYSQAQNKATQKYQSENLEQLSIRVAIGCKAELKAEAEKNGQSVAQYIVQAVNDRAGKKILTTSAGKRKPDNEE